MNPIAQELNQIINGSNPHIFEMLSDMGKELFFPFLFSADIIVCISNIISLENTINSCEMKSSVIFILQSIRESLYPI